MRTHMFVEGLYQVFTHQPNAEKLCQEAALMCQAAPDGKKLLTLGTLTHVCALAQHKPLPTFGPFVRSVASHQAMHASSKLKGVPAMPPISEVFRTETEDDRLQRLLNLPGLIQMGLGEWLQVRGTAEQRVWWHTQEKLTQVMGQGGALAAAREHTDRLAQKYGTEAAFMCGGWLNATPLAEFMAQLSVHLGEVAQKHTVSEGKDRRLPLPLITALQKERLVLRVLGALALPALAAVPNDSPFEDALCRALQPLMSELERAIAAHHEVAVLHALFADFTARGEVAIEALVWPDLKKQAARAYCDTVQWVEAQETAWQDIASKIHHEVMLERAEHKLSKTPQDGEWIGLRARALMHVSQDYEGALRALRSLPQRLWTCAHKALEIAALKASGHPDDAQAVLDDALAHGAYRANPTGFSELFSLRAQGRLLQGQRLRAWADAEAAVALDSASPLAQALRQEVARKLFEAFGQDLPEALGCSSASSIWLRVVMGRDLLFEQAWKKAAEVFEPVSHDPDAPPKARAWSQDGAGAARDMQAFVAAARGTPPAPQSTPGRASCDGLQHLATITEEDDAAA